MLISVITVVRNGADLIVPTIESLNAQTFRDFEHIVVDGLSTDGTVDVATRLARPENLRLVSGKDRGIYDAMNKGLGMARGEYVLFLNAGDRLHAPDTLATVAALAEDNDRPGVIYGQTDIVDSEGRYVGERHLRAPETLSLSSFSEGMTVCHQAFYALRKLTGRYNTKYRFSADFDWCIRILQHSHHNVYTRCVLADYLNEGATTRHRLHSLAERAAIMIHYYGFLRTFSRHFGFIRRAIRRGSL